jgi:hypothetical protein
MTEREIVVVTLALYQQIQAAVPFYARGMVTEAHCRELAITAIRELDATRAKMPKPKKET